jgi:hypothetical protein
MFSDHSPQRLLPIRAELAALLRAERVPAVGSQLDGLERAPEALATVLDRGSPNIGATDQCTVGEKVGELIRSGGRSMHERPPASQVSPFWVGERAVRSRS